MEVMKIACQKKKWQQNFIEIDILRPNKKKLRRKIWKFKIIWKIEQLETIWKPEIWKLF